MFTSFYSTKEEGNDNVFTDDGSSNLTGVNKLNMSDDFTSELVKVLETKASKLNELSELDGELESQITNLVKGYDFNKDPIGI